MNVRRMRRCIKFLRELPRKRFDFGVVYCHTECGSVGCVCGYLGEMFPTLVKFEATLNTFYQRFDYIWNVGGIDYDDYSRAFAKLMDIPLVDAHALVSPSNICPRSATPKQVADMLEAYMNNVLQKGKS